MTTQIDVVNDALRLLGEPHLTALDDPRRAARDAAGAWPGIVRAELRAHPWNFAVRRALLPALVWTPPFGYRTAYAMPADSVRLLECVGLARDDWAVEAAGMAEPDLTTAILTRGDGPLRVRYVSTALPVETWDPLFCEVVAAKLAFVLAEPITQSNTKKGDAMAVYRQALGRARRTDAIERPPEPFRLDDWVLARA